MPLIWKFQNPEASIFEKYFDITTYRKGSAENGLLYHFEVEGYHYHEYFFQVNKPTLAERVMGKSGYEAAFWYEVVDEDDMEFDPATKSYRRKQFEKVYELIPLDLLKELSEHFNEKHPAVLPEQMTSVSISTVAALFKKHFRISSYREERGELKEYGIEHIFKVENDNREFHFGILFPNQSGGWPDKILVGMDSIDENGNRKEEFVPLPFSRDLADFFTEKQKHDNR